ncbi:MAG: hypothetical protein JWP44_4684 [Mucilaginibacter sp.]|nr:hypothetical protein [Mucilaginibacter sp.]
MSAAPPETNLPQHAISGALRRLQWVFGAVLVALAIAFAALTRHWPMVGDAALLHYSVFLIEHGWAPYRDFADINMPGAYWATGAAMKLPWQPDVGWRIFDLGLVALAGCGYYVIARPYSRFAALFATAMLLLVHGQDGVQQAGQRDLVIAVLLVLGSASLIEGMRRHEWAYAVPFGLATGLAATIKPTAAPLGLVLLAAVALHQSGWRADAGQQVGERRRAAVLPWIAAGLSSMCVGPLVMLAWLWRHHALVAWLHLQQILLPYYASLERRPFGFTLSHSISPIAALVVLWLATIALARPRWPTAERLLIAAATVLNLLALLAQGKALPYQRYPMLAFLLLLISLDLATSLRTSGRSRYVAVAGLACGALIIAPLALLRIHRFDARPQEFDTMLAADLDRLGGSRLNGHVQCMDTIQDCLPTLFTLRWMPATNTLSDAALFGPTDGPTEKPAVQLMRQRFLQAADANPPLVIVVVSGSFLDSTSGYSKLAAWPEFASWLAAHYMLAVERTPPHMVRWWNRPQPPAGYRLYVAKDAMGR